MTHISKKKRTTFKRKIREKGVGEDLIKALKEVKAIKQGKKRPARIYQFTETDPRLVRTKLKMTQREFAEKFKVPLRTLRAWEQGTARPAGPSAVLLHIIAKEPQAVRRALKAA